ncbi:MAG TPA: DHA2 family efflux MFS transporter permease subunit [Aliicoccus persicus]|uniref:Quinolone resistance protein NorB n=1 Tax=Aliicoccus persicus TaxID=930138 RepID=A0A921DWZ4_9STAP|nr:DHA2 family efflux MFS transporter permease subunit [Aliicoccus persicus]
MARKFGHNGIIIVVIASTFLFAFIQFLLITAYPSIMAEFDINATEVQWLTTAYLLTSIIFIPMSAYLSNTYSTKWLLIIALLLLAIGTLIGGWSPTFEVLIFSRLLQAIGAGIILPLSQTILLIIFPPERRGFAMGLLGAVVNVAPASAPSISGVIIDVFDWRTLHWVMLPLVIATLVLAIFAMTDIIQKDKYKLDFTSIIFSAVGFSLFIFGLSNISVVGATDIRVILPVIIGLITIILFVSRQLKLTRPVLDVRLFKNGLFRLSVIMIAINLGLLLSTETILPMFAQVVLDTSAFLSGFLLLPGTILLSIMSLYSGNLYDKYGGKVIITLGFSLTTISLILLNLIGMDSSPYWIMLFFCVFMAGFGLTLAPLTTLAMNAVDYSDIPHGSAIVNTVRQLGMTIGVIVLTSIISITAATMDAPNSVGTFWGVTYAFIVMAFLAFVCVILSFQLRENRTRDKEDEYDFENE